MLFDWQGAWASVIHHPLFGIGITLGAYQPVSYTHLTLPTICSV